MINNKSKRHVLILSVLLAAPTLTLGQNEGVVQWNAEKTKMDFNLKHLSGVVTFTGDNSKWSTHHFSKVIHKPTNILLSPDSSRMKHVGFLNFFRVLTKGGYLSELRAEKAHVKPEKDGATLTWPPTIRRQAKIIIRFTFRQPNMMDMDMSVETLTDYQGFEILLSTYQAPGFVSGAYVATNEFGPVEPEQIRVMDQPMIHGVWPFFPRDEKGANTLTDGRHQKGRWYWRMAIGRRYGYPMAFFSKGDIDTILMGRPEDVYAVGVTYQGDEEDNLADHRSLYLSLLGEDLAAGQSKRTQMRLIIDQFGSAPEKHAALYEEFLKEVKNIPRTYYIDPTK
ncbi:hypothetical protein ACFL6U_03440 [Planctomycetota bacterium]